MIRYPIRPDSVTNRTLSRSEGDPFYAEPSTPSGEAEADHLQLRGDVPERPVEVLRGLRTELLFQL